jgi:hypothetical protein
MDADKTDLTIRPVVRGQFATYERGRGYVRQPVPSDGFIVETTKTTIFVPLERIKRELGEA